MSLSLTHEILVLVECNAECELTPASLAAVSFARRISQIKSCKYSLLLLYRLPNTPQTTLFHLGASEVLVCATELDRPFLAERITPTLARIVKERNAELFVTAATSTGKDLAPRIAALLDAAYISDCSKVSIENGVIAFHRPVYAGNAMAVCHARSSRVIVTVRQTEFPLATADIAEKSKLTFFTLDQESVEVSRVRRIGFDAVTTNRPRLTEAKVVVTGGRALSNRFNEVLSPLADCLNAAIGATRAACDAGIAPSDFQVGQTGKVVAPDLYFAIGVSGAVQHVAGMRGSRVIVAINSDPEAPIFSIADYGLIGDLFDIVPKLVAAIRTTKGI
jgi:electron transfer flavoprotein alpha subunit